MPDTALPSIPAGEGWSSVPPGPRRRLVDAATALFAERGSVATSVRDVTQACGLTPGALYNHFRSKEDLLGVIVRDVHLLLETSMAQAQQTVAGDPRAEFGVVVEVAVFRHARNRDRARVANREYERLTGPWRDEVLAIRGRLTRRVADVVRAGRDAGVFVLDPEVTPLLVATAVFGMAVGVSGWFVEGTTGTSADVAHRHAVLAYRMVGCRPDETALRRGLAWLAEHPHGPAPSGTTG